MCFTKNKTVWYCLPKVRLDVVLEIKGRSWSLCYTGNDGAFISTGFIHSQNIYCPVPGAAFGCSSAGSKKRHLVFTPAIPQKKCAKLYLDDTCEKVWIQLAGSHTTEKVSLGFPSSSAWHQLPCIPLYTKLLPSWSSEVTLKLPNFSCLSGDTTGDFKCLSKSC